MMTSDERIRATIGSLVIENATLTAEVERFRQGLAVALSPQTPPVTASGDPTPVQSGTSP